MQKPQLEELKRQLTAEVHQMQERIGEITRALNGRTEPPEEQAPTLWETLKDFDGIADDLPDDLAANIDHYLHGHPKR